MTVWPNGTKTRPSISSNYGPRAPIDTNGDGRPDTSSFHTGTDFVGFEEIKACDAGHVEYAAFNASNGYEVRIRHSNGALSRYYHMEPDLRVSAGQDVSEGQHIGDKGRTGLANGEHLHFRIDINGAHVDPLAYITARLDSIPMAPSLPGGVRPLGPSDLIGGYTKVKGDGISYWEPTGELGRRIQNGLKGYGYTGPVNGIWGSNTRKAAQRLAREGGYKGAIDGLIGPNTIKGLQNVARKGGYTGNIDGVAAEYTWNGVRRALGQ